MRLTFCQAQKVSKKAGRGKPSPATVITCGEALSVILSASPLREQ